VTVGFFSNRDNDSNEPETAEDLAQEGMIRSTLQGIMTENFLSDDLETAQRCSTGFQGSHAFLHQMMEGYQQEIVNTVGDDPMHAHQIKHSLNELSAIHVAVEHFDLMCRDHVRRLKGETPLGDDMPDFSKLSPDDFVKKDAEPKAPTTGKHSKKMTQADVDAVAKRMGITEAQAREMLSSDSVLPLKDGTPATISDKADELIQAAKDNMPTVSVIEHWLWHYGERDLGRRPGSFTENLMKTFQCADPTNQLKLIEAFPDYGTVGLMFKTENGMERVKNMRSMLKMLGQS
jgi:hypothetical protein